MKSIEDFTNLCTEEQTKRAVKLGAPIPPYEEGLIMINDVWYTNTKRLLTKDDDKLYIIPTTQQMLGWLRENNVCISIFTDLNWYRFLVSKYNGRLQQRINTNVEEIYEQAELAAIDAALDYLEEGK